MRITYLYWMKDDPDRVRTVAPEHAAYWRNRGLPGYAGGPFADRSGGLITFDADSLEQAAGIVAADPFVQEELLESSVVKQWMPEQASAQRSRPGEGGEGPTRPVVVDRAEAARFGSGGERPPGTCRRSRSDMSERGWVTVENAIEICRSPEDVFDYLTDITKEVEWNPRTRRVEKLTPGPIGLGTRFGAEWIKGNPAIVEYVRFERPMAWASIARSRRLDAKGEGRISPTEQGSRVVFRTKLRPKGLLALLLPLMRRTMHEREDQNLERVKAILEGTR